MSKGRTKVMAITILLSAALTRAQTANPNPKNFRLSFDGAESLGVAGFEIDFETAQNLAFSPVLVAARGPAPRLSLTLTPKGVAGISSWLNDVGNGATAAPKSVDIQSLDTDGGVLIEWRLDGVQPVAITQLSSGTGSQTTVSVVFAFEKLTVVRASTN